MPHQITYPGAGPSGSVSDTLSTLFWLIGNMIVNKFSGLPPTAPGELSGGRSQILNKACGRGSGSGSGSRSGNSELAELSTDNEMLAVSSGATSSTTSTFLDCAFVSIVYCFCVAPSLVASPAPLPRPRFYSPVYFMFVLYLYSPCSCVF